MVVFVFGVVVGLGGGLVVCGVGVVFALMLVGPWWGVLFWWVFVGGWFVCFLLFGVLLRVVVVVFAAFLGVVCSFLFVVA
ncbi:hypothetical protein ACQ9A5_26465, partial [Escherichia coli]|uniref:hypothetical protein n=1 Tax=Escherichia coli TaxID=562 RepID=UPI003D36669B